MADDDRILMLFENGEAASVLVNLYQPHPGDHGPLISADLVPNSYGQELRHTLELAAQAALAAVKRDISVPLPIRSAVCLQAIDKNDSNQDIIGQSGGLAFALAMACALLQQSFGSVAATGTVAFNGQVGAIDGIQTKLEAAADLLKDSGGWIFYPAANTEEIPKELLHSMQQNGLHPKPITTIDEALCHLQGNYLPMFPATLNLNCRKNLKLLYYPILTILVAFSISAIYYFDLQRYLTAAIKNVMLEPTPNSAHNASQFADPMQPTLTTESMQPGNNTSTPQLKTTLETVNTSKLKPLQKDIEIIKKLNSNHDGEVGKSDQSTSATPNAELHNPTNASKLNNKAAIRPIELKPQPSQDQQEKYENTRTTNDQQIPRPLDNPMGKPKVDANADTGFD